MKLSCIANVDNADRYNDGGSVSGVAIILGDTATSARRSTIQHYCVTLPANEVDCKATVHGAKVTLAAKAVLDFSQPLHLQCASVTRGQRLQIPRILTAVSTLSCSRRFIRTDTT